MQPCPKEADVKRELILSAAIHSFLAVAPAYGQEQEKEKPQEMKPAQTQNEEHKPADNKQQPAPKKEQKQQEQQSKLQQKQYEQSANQHQSQKQQEQAVKQQKDQQKVQRDFAKQHQQEEKQEKEQKEVARQQEQQDKSQRQQAASAQRENGGQRGVRIPDDRFREHFGHDHHFRVVLRDPHHFAYGGYVFELVHPWPVGWAYTDDCYIEQIGGAYYLFDLLHPGVRIVVIVVQ